MKDLGRKNYVLLQLRGTLQIAKLWIRKQLNLRHPSTTSPPPSEGRGTHVIEETGSEIQGAADGLRPGNRLILLIKLVEYRGSHTLLIIIHILLRSGTRPI